MGTADDGSATTQTTRNGSVIFSASTAYDAFSRLSQKLINAGTVGISQNYVYNTGTNNTGTLVTQYTTSYTGTAGSGSLQFSYTYDGNGNITRIARTDQTALSSSTYTYAYTYDEAGQLKTALDTETGRCYEYMYDEHGSILGAYTYQLNADGSTTLLESRIMSGSGGYISSTEGTVNITRDATGAVNTVTKAGKTYQHSWGEGRMLVRYYLNAGNYVRYSYNADGLRVVKAVTTNGVTTTTNYYWGPNGLAGFQTGSKTVTILYDADGSPVGFTLNGTVYSYIKNLQGDVIRILDAAGNTVVSYSYDPWGVPTISGNTELAAINPCSYRGYDYDEETGYYYLQSRYYDPEVGRFINQDDCEYLGFGDSPVAYNLFVYCGNEPIARADPTGHFLITVAGITITYELIMFTVCFIAMIPLIINLLRDLPQILSYFSHLIQDLVDAVTIAVKKSMNAQKQKRTAKHHIIAKNAWRATYARRVWKGYGFSIDDSRNLVPLNVVFHSYLHITPYYEAVNALVYAGTRKGKDGVVSVLLIIHVLLASINDAYF